MNTRINKKRVNERMLRCYVAILTVIILLAGINPTFVSAFKQENWIIQNTPNSEFLNGGVIYGNGLFMALGNYGAILTSNDGVDWNSQTSGTTHVIFDATYGNNKYVAVGSNGTILTSNDGVNWSSQTSGTGEFIYGITYGNNKYVAVGSNGTILTSDDGVNWSSQSSGTANTLFDVTYNNGQFVAIGNNGWSASDILVSNDGVTWKNHQITPALYGVAYGNGKYVGVGFAGAIRTSTDGVTWSNRTANTSSSLNGITYGNNMFVAVGGNGTISTSTDGEYWTSTTVSSATLRDISYSNGMFVAAGDQTILKYIFKKLIYDDNGAESGDVLPVNYYDEGDTISVPDNSGNLTRTGYTFAGWNTQADGSGTSYSVGEELTIGAEDITLYAQWKAETYTVTFDAQEGTVSPTTQTKRYNATYGVEADGETSDPLPSPTRPGYTFAGWNTEADGQGQNITDATTVSTASDHTLYAQWTINSPNDGPQIISVVPGDSHVTIQWSSVPFATGYHVYQSTIQGYYESPIATVPDSEDGPYSYEVTGLTNGTTYYFVVTAYNESGESDFINEISATPQVPSPGAPVLHAPVVGDARVSLSWAPVDGATEYKIYHSQSAGQYGEEPATVTEAVYGYDVTGLTNGATYYFVVKAENPGGLSDASNEVSATPMTVPAVPTDVKAVAGNQTATVSFVPPANNGGSPIIRYEVIDQQGNTVGTGNFSPITITGLTNGGSYTFTVKAINSVGKSEASEPSNEILPKAPPSGGGGGGSIPSTPSAPPTPSNERSVSAGQSATFTLNGVTLTIPSGTMKTTTKVKVVQVTNTANLSIPSNLTLIGDVFDITKDVSGHFAKAITITLPFDKSKFHVDTHKLAIYWLNEETEEWIILDKIKVDMTKSTVSGEVNHFTKFAVFATEKEREEVIEGEETIEQIINLTDIAGHWAERNILNLVEMGAINGYTDGKFKPNNHITRAEFASILVQALGLEMKGNKLFNDTANHWAKDVIATAYAHGIINGYSETTFGPNDLITREQMASMIVKAFGLDHEASLVDYADQAHISAWAVADAETAIAHGVIGGYNDGTIKPKANATRAEAVSVIVRALKE